MIEFDELETGNFPLQLIIMEFPNDRCIFCLENQYLGTVARNEIKMDNIQQLLLYITGSSKRVSVTDIPPLCEGCYDKLKELQILHENLLEIQRRIQSVALEMRKSVRDCSEKSERFRVLNKEFHDVVIAEGTNDVIFPSRLPHCLKLEDEDAELETTSENELPIPIKKEKLEMMEIEDDGSPFDPLGDSLSPLLEEKDDLEEDQKYDVEVEDNDYFDNQDDDEDEEDDDNNDDDDHPDYDPLQSTSASSSESETETKPNVSHNTRKFHARADTNTRTTTATTVTARPTSASTSTKTESTKGKFTCNLCDKSYVQYESLFKHLGKCHRDAQRCHICWSTHIYMELPNGAKRHMEEHLGHPGWSCQECSKVYPTRNLILDHLKKSEKCSRNGENQHKRVCNSCRPEQEFKSEKDFYKHVFDLHEKDESLEKSYKCKMCPCKYRTELGLDFHVNSHVTERSWGALVRKGKVLCPTKPDRVCLSGLPIVNRSVTCQYCKCAFPKADFDAHIRSAHKVHLTQKCKLCTSEVVLIDREDYIKHLEKVHNQYEVQKPCDICDDQAFNRICDLRRHYFHVHQIGAQFLCERCEKIYYTRTALKDHVRRHHRSESKKSFPCDMCFKNGDIRGGILGSAKALEKHMAKMHFEGKFKCERCQLGFRCKFDFTQHEKNDHKNDPLICATCGAQFTHTKNLRCHEQSVHDKRGKQGNVYTCSECGKGFSLAWRLKHHERVHSTEKLYQCEHCPKSFKDRDHFRAHHFTHSSEEAPRPFVCEVCKKGFFTNSLLKRHRRSHGKKKSKTQ